MAFKTIRGVSRLQDHRVEGAHAFGEIMHEELWHEMVRDSVPAPTVLTPEARRWTFSPGAYGGLHKDRHVIWVHTHPIHFDLEHPVYGHARGAYGFNPGVISLQKAGEYGAVGCKQPCSLMTVSIDADRFTSFVESSSVRFDDLLDRFGEPDETLLQIALALSAERPTQRSELLNEAMTNAFFARLVDRHSHRPPQTARRIAPNAIRRVEDYVQANLGTELSIDTMASVAGLSIYHFSRAFARSTGTTPHRFVMKARVRLAERLLLDRTLTIAEIAYRSGFADQSHLTRWMRRETGTTPGQVRAKD